MCDGRMRQQCVESAYRYVTSVKRQHLFSSYVKCKTRKFILSILNAQVSAKSKEIHRKNPKMISSNNRNLENQQIHRK